MVRTTNEQVHGMLSSQKYAQAPTIWCFLLSGQFCSCTSSGTLSSRIWAVPVFFLLFLVIRFLLWQFLVDCVRGLQNWPDSKRTLPGLPANKPHNYTPVRLHRKSYELNPSGSLEATEEDSNIPETPHNPGPNNERRIDLRRATTTTTSDVSVRNLCIVSRICIFLNSNFGFRLPNCFIKYHVDSGWEVSS